LSQAQSPDDLLISSPVLARQILQQLISSADQLQQPAPRSMILLVNVKMLAKLIDPFGQQGNLNFRRAGILFVNLVRANNIVLLIGCNRHLLSMLPTPKPSAPRGTTP